MQLDARHLTPESALECDVCIIGAGPAGISVALSLAASGMRVTILESGSLRPDPTTEPTIQDLNAGATVGDAYSGLRATRHRAVGGTVNAWNTEVGGSAGAKYVPLDPWDLDLGTGAPVPGWPLDYATLHRYYDRAQKLCGLGPFSYDADNWQTPGRAAFSMPAGSLLTSRIYQFGQGRCFTVDYVNELVTRDNVTLVEHASVVSLVADAERRITRAQIRASTGGSPFSIAARFFVLAAGAIENARLLLASERQANVPLFAGRQWIGKCLMEHPRDMSLTLAPSSRDMIRAAGLFDAHASASGLTVCGRLALTAEAATSQRLPNFSITLLPKIPPPGFISRSLQRLGLARDRRGYGWSHEPDPSKFFSRFRLLINLEQRPSPANRVVLARECDALGVPRAELHWTWSGAEQVEWERTRSLIISAIESAGLGKVESQGASRPDPNAHHHAGTTRMSDEPDWGVVDRDGRVHGTPNLYVAGASVFPSAGFANPTLTIVALAARLGEHLSTQSPAAVRGDCSDSF